MKVHVIFLYFWVGRGDYWGGGIMYIVAVEGWRVVLKVIPKTVLGIIVPGVNAE